MRFDIYRRHSNATRYEIVALQMRLNTNRRYSNATRYEIVALKMLLDIIIVVLQMRLDIKSPLFKCDSIWIVARARGTSQANLPKLKSNNTLYILYITYIYI